MTRLTLYSRGNCHLCEEMLDALSPLLAGRAELEVYVGYRKLRAELNNGAYVTVDEGGHVGVRIRF